MADTEDKVNKAKKLIHNVIETVSTSLPLPFKSSLYADLDNHRLLPFQKARTSSSVTNSASLLLSTELYVMMRTRHARTAARLATGSTTVPRSRTSPLASSAVCVVTQAIWVATVLIGRGARAGVTKPLAVDHRPASVEKPTLTMRFVCPSCGATIRDTNANKTCSNSWQRLAVVPHLHASRLGLATLTERPSRGSEDPLEVRLPGATATKIAINMTEVIAALVAWVGRLQADLLLGPAIAANVILTAMEVTAITAANRTPVVTAVPPHPERRHGTRLRLLRLERSLTEATLVQVLTQDTRRCLLLLALEGLRLRLLTT